VELTRQKGRAVVVEEVHHHVAADQGGLATRAGRWPCVDLHPDRGDLGALGGKPQFVEQPGEPDERRVHRERVLDPGVHRVGLGSEIALDAANKLAKIEGRGRPFQGEVGS
jgi:hypothetical protein